jgi:ABC-type uncharacterized transport system fused permease/ATPase subunit
VYPILLGLFINLRADLTTDALEEVENRQNAMLDYVYQAVDCYQVVSDYRRRQQYVEDLVEFIDGYNSANREKNQLVTNNTAFPKWVSVLLVVFWYLYFGGMVIDGVLSLGFFLADLKIIEKFGTEFEKLYKVIMAMEATFPDLARVVGILNTPTDLEHRLLHERLAIEKTQTLRKEHSTRGPGALDRVPIIIQDLQFSFGGSERSFSFKGNVEIEQGQMVCFVGGHGQGKSTLLKVVAGAIFPEFEAGELFIPSHLRVLHVPVEPHFLRKPLLQNLVLGTETEEDRSITRVRAIMSRLKLDHLLHFLDTDDDYNWQHSLTLHDASLLNLARALIANPSVLAIHKPTLACSDVFGILVIDMLKEFVKSRGLCHEKVSSQHTPRTVLYTSLRKKSCEAADLIIHVTPGRLRRIDLHNVTDELFN